MKQQVTPVVSPGTNRMLTLAEAAARLGVCVATVRRMIDRDWLPARRVGRQYRIPVEAFNRWCERLDVRAGR